MSHARSRRVFAWCLAGSALLHLIFLGLPGWKLPFAPEPVRIEATLVLPPTRHASVQPPPEPSKPKPAVTTPRKAGTAKRVIAQAPQADAPATVAALPAVESTEPVAPQGEGGVAKDVTVPPAQSAPLAIASAPVAPPVSSDPQATQMWPHEGRIRFQVRYGAAMEVGEMIHTWSHDGERYTMRAEAATVGLARLVKNFSATQQSQGLVGPEGLAPSGFQEDLNGKQSHAVFDWANHRVTQSRPQGVRELPFEGLAQDVLSLAHHMAFQPDTQERLDLFVVAGRWAAKATLTQVANERLYLPWGVVVTRHFHCEARDGEFGIDIWLSREHRNAPVRIRVDDRKQGHVVDEIAVEMTLDGREYKFRLTPEQEELYRG